MDDRGRERSARRGGRTGKPTTRSPGRRGRRMGYVRGSASSDGRIRLLRIAFIVAFALIGGKAVALASSPGNLATIAASQQLHEVTLPAPRGAILDRNGVELAVGEEERTVFATPYMLPDRVAAARELARALHLKKSQVLTALEGSQGFAYIARKIDPKLADRALSLKLPGVGSYPEEKRVYPMGSLAMQVLGLAGMDNTGLAGIEYEYNSELSGRAGSQLVVRDPAGTPLKILRAVQPRPGVDVRLTIDQAIQYTAEQVLTQTVRQFQAKSATAIVENPQTGEIYAMANVPLVNASTFGTEPARARNRAVTDTYEPGSTFKVVTVAGCLSEGLVKPSTSFWLQPSIRVADRIIHDADPRPAERFTVRRILAESSNVGAVILGEMLKEQGMLRWIHAFGFGKPTGIDFPGEVGGLVPQDWSGSTIGNVPIGQGIGVTAIQMATAYSAIANGGLLVQPRLVDQIGDTVTQRKVIRRVISPTVAKQLRSMLSNVVADGTGVEAQIPGYTVAGKTGTAQVALPNGRGYSQTKYVASFVGFVPAQHPQLVVLVVVNEPSVHYGGVVAAPAFRQIASFALQRLEIAP